MHPEIAKVGIQEILDASVRGRQITREEEVLLAEVFEHVARQFDEGGTFAAVYRQAHAGEFYVDVRNQPLVFRRALAIEAQAEVTFD